MKFCSMVLAGFLGAMVFFGSASPSNAGPAAAFNHQCIGIPGGSTYSEVRGWIQDVNGRSYNYGVYCHSTMNGGQLIPIQPLPVLDASIANINLAIHIVAVIPTTNQQGQQTTRTIVRDFTVPRT